MNEDRVPIAATENRDVDWVDVTGWGVFKGHAIPVDVARYIAEKVNLYHASRTALGAQWWRDISTCPKDGSHFLARQVVVADEYDDDNRLIRKAVREEFTVVAYWAFGGVVQYPWNGGIPSNVTYILWQSLPAAPTAQGGAK